MITHDHVASAFDANEYYALSTILKRCGILLFVMLILALLSASVLQLVPAGKTILNFVSNWSFVVIVLSALLLVAITPWYRLDPVGAIFTAALLLGFSCFLVTASVFLYKMMAALEATQTTPAALDSIVRNQLSLIAILVSMGSVTAAVLGWWVQRRITRFEALVDQAKEVAGTLDGYVGTCAKLALVGADVAISISLPKLNRTQQIPHDTWMSLQGLASIFEDKSTEAKRIRSTLNESGNGGRLHLAYAIYLFGRNPLSRDMLTKAEAALRDASDTRRPLTPPHIRAQARLRAGIVQRQLAGVHVGSRRKKLIQSIHTFDELSSSDDLSSFEQDLAITGLCITLLSVAIDPEFAMYAEDVKTYGPTPDALLHECLARLQRFVDDNRLAKYYYCKAVLNLLRRQTAITHVKARQHAATYAVELLQEYRGGRYLGDAEIDPFIRLNYLQCVLKLCDVLEELKTQTSIQRGADSVDRMEVHALRAEAVEALRRYSVAAEAYLSDEGYVLTVYDEESDREVSLEEFRRAVGV